MEHVFVEAIGGSDSNGGGSWDDSVSQFVTARSKINYRGDCTVHSRGLFDMNRAIHERHQSVVPWDIDNPLPNGNLDYFGEPVIYDGQSETILNAFDGVPVPGSDPSTWPLQGGPRIAAWNVQKVTFRNMTIWGGLPSPLELVSQRTDCPLVDIYFDNVLFAFIDEEALAWHLLTSRKCSRLRGCQIDPYGDGTFRPLAKKLVVPKVPAPKVAVDTTAIFGTIGFTPAADVTRWIG